jgi:D-amino-acid oxidase
VDAALWYPYLAFPLDLVTGWSAATYRELELLAKLDDTGVLLREGTELHHAVTPDPWWRSAVPTLTRVADPPAPFADGWTFVAPVVEMPVYLRWLVERIDELGGTLTRMALRALPDGAEVVVNATGLGARQTAQDQTVFPVRGQVVYVEQIGLDRWWLDETGPTYVVPRSDDIVVGGTDDEGDWSRTPDPVVAQQILDRAVRIVPELAKAKVIAHKVGLRPARPAVRLELEERGRSRVVHCYGHGGAGVTLSWGCADAVASLV